MAFNLPYFFDYPPYFTLQSVQETRKKQSALWQQLILSYCRHHKVYKVSLTAEELPIFVNQKINRRLSVEAKRAFLEDLVASGHGLWLDRDQELCLVLWKKLDVWAETVHQWARSCGMEDSVMTIDELSTGSEVAGTGKSPLSRGASWRAQVSNTLSILIGELQGAPRELLLSAIRLLEKRGKAKLFKGTSADDDGVKFFP